MKSTLAKDLSKDEVVLAFRRLFWMDEVKLNKTMAGRDIIEMNNKGKNILVFWTICVGIAGGLLSALVAFLVNFYVNSGMFGIISSFVVGAFIAGVITYETKPSWLKKKKGIQKANQNLLILLSAHPEERRIFETDRNAFWE